MIDRNSPVTEDELHAYVDGELPADRRRSLLLARGQSRTGCIGSVLAGSSGGIRAHFGATIGEPMPQRLELDQIMKHERANGRSWMAMAAAAASMAFVVGGAAGWMARGASGAARAALTSTPAKLSTLISLMWSRYVIPSKCPAASAST